MKTFNQFQAECWKTHKKVGMKMKGGKLVNCVPKTKRLNRKSTKKRNDKFDLTSVPKDKCLYTQATSDAWWCQ